MRPLLGLSRFIDRINGFIGQAVAWLVLAAVCVSAGNAVIRKSFNVSSNAWLELQWYLFGAVFMLCAAWTLRENEHVRVDFLSQQLSMRTRLWIDLVCHLVFLMPFAVLMAYLAWPFFWSSFLSGEQSNNASGLIRWPAKLSIVAGFLLLTAQGVSEIVKKAATLSGHLPWPDETAVDLPPQAKNASESIGSGGGVHE